MHSLHRRVLHLSISAGFGFSCYLRDVLLRAVGIRPKIPATIIYYHVVPYEHRKRFAAQMDALLRRAEVVRADVSSPLTPTVRYVAVTFDDGSETVLTNAFPELERRQIPFTVFMITGMFGQSVSWERSPERLMSVDELRKLSKSDLVTIGSHTVSHPMLPRLVDSSALAELRNSKEQLQALIGREVTLFCFPYGGFNTWL